MLWVHATLDDGRTQCWEPSWRVGCYWTWEWSETEVSPWYTHITTNLPGVSCLLLDLAILWKALKPLFSHGIVKSPTLFCAFLLNVQYFCDSCLPFLARIWQLAFCLVLARDGNSVDSWSTQMKNKNRPCHTHSCRNLSLNRFVAVASKLVESNSDATCLAFEHNTWSIARKHIRICTRKRSNWMSQ